MIETLFLELFPLGETRVVLENTSYNFAIKHINPSDVPYQIIYTDGLHKNCQSVAKKHVEFERIELYFCLPNYWDIDQNKWPIYWLDKLAQVPQKNNTWYGPGDTIPAGNPPKSLTEKFEANHFMLVEPIEVAEEFDKMNFTEMNVKFFGIVPIFQQELDYKLRNSAKVLTQRLQKKGYSEKIDLFRSPVCRKRFLGF